VPGSDYDRQAGSSCPRAHAGAGFRRTANVVSLRGGGAPTTARPIGIGPARQGIQRDTSPNIDHAHRGPSSAGTARSCRDGDTVIEDGDEVFCAGGGGNKHPAGDARAADRMDQPVKRVNDRAAAATSACAWARRLEGQYHGTPTSSTTSAAAKLLSARHQQGAGCSTRDATDEEPARARETSARWTCSSR